ncbi:hypothetical protein TWF730_004779 [Orbilia blumenaviensis]|uniref:Coat protein n=1 Tax=Orbilia blumenaviensis TaxID=1796055 RepID=A0AAV9TWP2_9PEZI
MGSQLTKQKRRGKEHGFLSNVPLSLRTIKPPPEDHPNTATLDGPKSSTPVFSRTYNMTTVLLPDMLATQDNHESIKRQIPKPLRKIIYFSSFDIWWVDGREDLDEILIPLQIAQRAVIVRGWLPQVNFNLINDPIPDWTISELLKCNRMDKILAEYGAKAFLFLVSGTVLMLYDSHSQMECNFAKIPPYIAGYATIPIPANIVPTCNGVGNPDQANFTVGQNVQLASTKTSSACAGVTVRRRSDGRLFDTIPSHLPHLGFLNQRWAISKSFDYFFPRSVFLESFDRISYGLGEMSETVRDVSITFDPDLTTRGFPINYAHDLSLVATDTALDPVDVRLQWSQLESSPFGKLVRLLNPAHTRYGDSFPQCWSVSIGLALCRTYKEWSEGSQTTMQARITEDDMPMLARSWLWRAGTRDDSPFTTLGGLSGSALALHEQDKTWGVIGFQNFEVRLTRELKSASTITGANKTKKMLDQGIMGFHGSFILPRDLTANYEVVNPVTSMQAAASGYGAGTGQGSD